VRETKIHRLFVLLWRKRYGTTREIVKDVQKIKSTQAMSTGVVWDQGKDTFFLISTIPR